MQNYNHNGKALGTNLGPANARNPSTPRQCGRLFEPQDGGGESDDGEVVSGGLLVSGGDASELLEFADAALDQVTFLVEVAVERVLRASRRIVRDDRDGAGLGDGLAEVVGIVGGIG